MVTVSDFPVLSGGRDHRQHTEGLGRNNPEDATANSRPEASEDTPEGKIPAILPPSVAWKKGGRLSLLTLGDSKC